jgi:nucleotide-binding universal stress UspA family protein
MPRPIIVPLDGAPLSEHALPSAAELARRSGAELRLVRAHVPPVAIAAEGFVGLYPVVEDAALREAEAAYFRQLLPRVRGAHPDLTVTAEVVELGDGVDVPDALVRAAAGAELVVMTTHGRGTFTRFWLGSTADEFVRQSPVPVLLLRPAADAPVDLARRPQVRNVLVPLDGSRLAERIVPVAAHVGRLLGGEVTLLLVLDGGPRGGAAPVLEPTALPAGWNPDAAAEQAKGYLDGVARDFKDRGATVRAGLVAHGSPAEAILHHAQAEPDTLTALATHGRGGLTRLLLGSVADKVIRGSAGPVLVYRPGEVRG